MHITIYGPGRSQGLGIIQMNKKNQKKEQKKMSEKNKEKPKKKIPYTQTMHFDASFGLLTW